MDSSRRLLGNGSLYVVGTLAPIVTLLAVTPVVTRLLGAEGYGNVAIAITIYQFSSVLLSVGLPASITRNAILEKGGFPAASGLVVVGACLVVVIGAVVAITAPMWSGVIFPKVDPLICSLAVCAGGGLAVVTLGQGLLRADERVKTFVALGVSSALLPPLLGLTLIWTVERGPGLYVLGLAMGYSLAGIAAVAIAIRHTSPRISRAELFRALRIGAPTVPHLASVPLLLTIMVSIATINDGLVMAGQLQIAVMLGSAIITVLNAVNNAWSPMIYRAAPTERAKLRQSSTFLVSVLVLVLVSGFTIVAPWAIRLVGGPLVDGPVPVHASIVVAAGGVFHVLYLANIHATFLSGRTWPLAILTPLAATLSIGALLVTGHMNGGKVSLLAYAAVWPIFYAVQATFSFALARFGPISPVHISWGFVPLVLGFLVCAQGVLFQPQPLFSAIAGAVAVAVGLAIAWTLRRRSG